MQQSNYFDLSQNAQSYCTEYKKSKNNNKTVVYKFKRKVMVPSKGSACNVNPR
jgi:hypothetical protein